jgi:hypothetical protein
MEDLWNRMFAWMGSRKPLQIDDKVDQDAA